jgi:transposase
MGVAKQDVKTAAATPPRHSEQFKRDAVRLVTEESYTFAAAAKAVGVSDQTLRLWRKKFGPQPKPCGEDATLDELRAEVQRLKRELRRAELEREILKKAAAYFAKESQ